MNEQALEYWNKFWKDKPEPKKLTAEQWGFEGTPLADELAQLMIEGKKTATCSAHVLYELENEPIPEVGEYTIVLSSKNIPLCIIKTTDVQIIPMNEVTEDFARAEGEGDLSYSYWWDGHVRFFTEDLAAYGLEFSEDMPLVCERFEVVFK